MTLNDLLKVLDTDCPMFLTVVILDHDLCVLKRKTFVTEQPNVSLNIGGQPQWFLRWDEDNRGLLALEVFQVKPINKGRLNGLLVVVK